MMEKQVRVYAVEKANGWSVLSPAQQRNGIVPKTVQSVHVTWGDGKENKQMEIDRATFLATYRHIRECYWEVI